MAVVTKVWVEEDSCTACEACVAAAPDALELKDNIAAPISTDPAFLKEHSDEIVAAAAECPCEAIKYETA